MKLKLDIRTGQRFGRLLVVNPVGKIKQHLSFLCQCDCGVLKIIRGSNLKAEQVRSCGCLGREIQPLRNRKHGMRNTAVYRVWVRMISRCTNPKGDSYKDYGGRGIKVCERWKNSFEMFLADMPPFPGKGWSIERNNVNGDYEPENCKWLPLEEQARNKRNNFLLPLGTKYGRLTVTEGPFWDGFSKYQVKCDCGRELVVIGSHLKNGHTRSCGCLLKECQSHFGANTRLAWSRKRASSIPHETLGLELTDA